MFTRPRSRVALRGENGYLAGLAALASLLLAGCASFPDDRIIAHSALTPEIRHDPESGEYFTLISVLSYNVEGLPWPARNSRASRLREIGRQLAEMRAQGTAPDVVLLQEVFTTQAAQIGVIAGYQNRIRGPSRRADRPRANGDEADPGLAGSRKRLKGEGLGRLFSSGLYMLTDFAVREAGGQAFPRRACAGFDCLANKGLQHARLGIPGVPQAIDLFNTHLNSASASRVSPRRSLLAHQQQIAETIRFLGAARDPDNPLIFGGDFNMRHSDARLERFAQTFPYTLVHRHCARTAGACEVGLSWDGDEPWRDTQDLQGFDDGLVRVRPVSVEAMFDLPWRGRPLSDHDGLLVVYRLSWPIERAAEPAVAPEDRAPLSAPGGEK